MKYNRGERLEIGRQVYMGELTKYQAAEKYGIGEDTARKYMRMYRDENNLQAKNHNKPSSMFIAKSTITSEYGCLKEFKTMTRKELIQELARTKITEALIMKRLEGETEWNNKSIRQCEYEIIWELSEKFSVNLLCQIMGVPKGGFYNWKKKHVEPMEER